MAAWAPQPPAARAAMFTRISASRPPDQPLSAFASGASAHTLLSPPAIQHALLSLLSTPAALPLRATCKEARAAVAGHAWRDRDTVIRGSIAAWRRCFPRAQCANAGEGGWMSARPEHRRTPVVDADLAHLQGLLELSLVSCAGVTDAGFAHLRGIHTLDMRFCKGVTDAALVHLAGIHTLDMSGCSTITGAGFEHLRGIHTLKINHCDGITDAAFVHLAGIHTLDMSRCWAITDAAFAHLAGIHTLRVVGCVDIPGAALVHLHGTHTLDMACCASKGFGFLRLRGISSLALSSWSPPAH